MDSKNKTSQDIFKCQKCGDCCKGFGGTFVTKNQIINICSFINITPDLFIKKYCSKSGSRYLISMGKDGYCFFFDKINQCTIHPVKPYMCKIWPFIKTMIKHPENWDIIQASCPGMQKNINYENLKNIVVLENKLMEDIQVK